MKKTAYYIYKRVGVVIVGVNYCENLQELSASKEYN